MYVEWLLRKMHFRHISTCASENLTVKGLRSLNFNFTNACVCNKNCYMEFPSFNEINNNCGIQKNHKIHEIYWDEP